MDHDEAASARNLVAILQLAYSGELAAASRDRVLSHWLGKRLPIWPEPAPKESIRASFELETGAELRAAAGKELQLATASTTGRKED